MIFSRNRECCLVKEISAVETWSEESSVSLMCVLVAQWKAPHIPLHILTDAQRDLSSHSPHAPLLFDVCTISLVQLIKIHNRGKWESFVITLRKEILGERTLAPWPLYTWWQIYIGVPYVVYLVEKISKWHLRGRITVLTWRIAFARNWC